MYTAEQYARAKAALNDPDLEKKVGAERMGKWARNVAEYETAQGAPGGPGLSEQDVARLETPLAIGGALPNESIAPDYQYHPPEDFDEKLPNATKRKRYSAPPEYVTKQPGKALAQLAKNRLTDPLNGSNGAMYFEPSEKQFAADMGEYLKAKGVEPGSEDYRLAFADYKDRKWEQAYKQAEATDSPLLRVAYVPENANGWTKLQAYLADKTDAASAFAQGFASGGTLGMTRALHSDADREQLARHPIAETLGEFGGAVTPGGLASKLTGTVGRGAARLGPVGAAAVAGGVAAPLDVAAHAGAEELSNRLHGRPVDQDAKGQFASKLLGSALLGTGMGVVGEYLASGAQGYREHVRSPLSKFGTELTNAESTGTATDALSGLKPSSDVQKYLDKARGPVPGEDRPLPSGSAVEYAAGDVRGPVVAQQSLEHTAALQRMERESGRMYQGDAGLRQPKPMGELVRTLREHILERSQPEAASEFLPAPGQSLGARNNAQLIDFARKLVRPRLALDVDAAKEAARTGGQVVSLEDAERMGFAVKGLENEANPATGVPHNAPTLSGDSFPWFPQANPVEVLPKYTKEQLAAHADELVGYPAATPEQAAALNKWSFGHDEAIRGVQRGDPDAAIIQKRLEAYGGPVDKLGVPHEQHLAEAKEAARHIGEYLAATPPSSKLPFVYRGLVLSREEAKKFLQRGEFDLGNSASSVSADPAVARSFVARNVKPGDVGITLKLEHNGARDISPYAADRVKIEKELLMPGGSKFSAVNRFEDASNPGHYIVVGKQAPPEGDLGATRPEIEPPAVEVPPGHSPKTFRVILEPRAYDAMKMEAQIKAIDQAGKAGTEAKVDPVWPELMRAARVDREQFGKAWSGLKNIHHEELTALEQRAAHAGITESKPYDQMSGNAQKTANAALTNYGVAPQETNKALGELADNAGVRQNLETLRGTRAYSALKEKATPALNESITTGGAFTRLGGLLPGARLRGDAVARSVARGPEGDALFVRKFNTGLMNEPLGREVAPSGPFGNLLSMGRGALGIKTGSVYDSYSERTGPGSSLSPEEKAKLQQLLESQ